MSISIMAKVWERAIESVPKLILLKLADHADDKGGSIYPGAESLRAATGLADVSTVRRRLKQFRQLGVLVAAGEVAMGRTRRRVWRIDLDALRRHFPLADECAAPPSLAKLATRSGSADEDDTVAEGHGVAVGPVGPEVLDAVAPGPPCEPDAVAPGPPCDAVAPGPPCEPDTVAPQPATPWLPSPSHRGSPATLNIIEPPRNRQRYISDGLADRAGEAKDPDNGRAESFALTAPGSRPAGLAAEAMFERFWQAYPRKVAKGQARKAWHKAAAKAAPETIINGARRYGREQADNDSQFVKHPATWLAGECWLDEPASRRAGGNRQGPPSVVEAAARAASGFG